MEIVKKQATNFITRELNMSLPSDVIDNLKSQLYKYSRTADKITFIEECLIKIKEEKAQHLKECKSPHNCLDLDGYNDMIFFAEQELEENGINNKDLITPNESFTLITKLDDLISELRTIKSDINQLKAGQQITYDDFIEQFENLKKQTYLDKKTWRQVFLGKLFEMTVSGVVSESLSKKITELFGDLLTIENMKKLTG